MNKSEALQTDVAAAATPARVTPHACFALATLVGANLLNYVDRQILPMLAESIKADFSLDDAQLGFLMGTAFAVFYAVVGIAFGRVSDRISRKKLITAGLLLWSAMTALGATAVNFVTLGLARIGVGIGEATANPCTHSLAADIFPAKNRALVMGFLVAGSNVGGALALLIGGWFVSNWDTACSSLPLWDFCRLPDWKATLIAVGLPGIPMALLLMCIREPRRNIPRVNVPKVFVEELSAAIPPFTLWALYRKAGRGALLGNLRAIALIAALAALLVYLTGDIMQWVAVGIGVYSVYTWGIIQRERDRPLYALTFGDPTFMLALGGASLLACIGGAVRIWVAPYAMRTLDMEPSMIGLNLGLIGVIGAIAGVLLGGMLTDIWKRHDLRAPLWVAMIALLGELPFIFIMLAVDTQVAFFAAYAFTVFFGALWGGAYGGMIQDLVIPRMRGAAAAAFSLVVIVLSSSIGPYWAGKVSVITGSLNSGLYSLFVFAPFVFILLFVNMRLMQSASPASRRQRALDAGEPAAAL